MIFLLFGKTKTVVAAYCKKLFGMYGGEEELVTLHGRPEMVSILLDRFGTDASLRELPDKSFTMTVRVIVSPQFLSWVAGLAPDVVIREPASVRTRMREFLAAAAQDYQNN